MHQLKLANHVSAATFPLYRADSWWARLRGLHRVPRLSALWLYPCRSVQTFSLRYPISLLWLDNRGQLLVLERYVPPRRCRWHWQAHSVIEIPWPGLARLSGPIHIRQLGE